MRKLLKKIRNLLKNNKPLKRPDYDMYQGTEESLYGFDLFERFR